MSPHRVRPTRLLSAVAVGAATLLLAACGSSTTDAGSSAPAALPKTLVFSPLSLAPPALKGLSEGVKGYAGSQGWEVVVQDPDFNASKQVQSLSEVLDSGRAGAAWIIAVAPQSMADTITAAQGKGIPILVNGQPQEYGFTGPQAGITFDYIDYKTGGSSLGDQTGQCITQKLGGNAKVLWLQSAQGSAGKAEFDGASQSTLTAAAPGATVAQTLIATDRTKAQTDVSAALQGNPDITAVMAANDEAALGAIGAFAAAGKNLPCVVDFGGNDEVLGAVKSGTVFSSVALQFSDDMKQSFDTLVKMQADPKATGLVLTVPQKIVTASG